MTVGNEGAKDLSLLLPPVFFFLSLSTSLTNPP